MTRLARVGLCLVGLFASVALILAQEVPASRPASPGQALGLEFGFLSVPFARPDPYAFAASAGLWYERALGESSPLRIGAWFNLSGFRPLDPYFSYSLMCAGGAEFGYAIKLYESADSRISLRPLVRLGWYAREIESATGSAWASRPILSAGCLFDLALESFDFGLSALLSAPMDREPVLVFGISQRLGLWL